MPRAATALLPFEPTPSDPFDRRKAAHLLRRAGFGASPAEIAGAVEAGLEVALVGRDAGVQRSEGRRGAGGRGGFAGRRTAGIMLEEMKVTEVVEGGPAEKAGIKPGDVLLKVAGKAVANREEYVEAMQAAGREFTVTVKRDGQEVEVKLAFPAPQQP